MAAHLAVTFYAVAVVQVVGSDLGSVETADRSGGATWIHNQLA